MKIYDKNIYKTQQIIKTTVIIIVCFLFGFVVGYFSNSLTTNNYNQKNNNNSNNNLTNNISTSIISNEI